MYEELDPAYATTCSDVTLYSVSKGFFREIAEETVAMARADQWLHKFEGVDDSDKVAAVKANKKVSIITTAVLRILLTLFKQLVRKFWVSLTVDLFWNVNCVELCIFF